VGRVRVGDLDALRDLSLGTTVVRSLAAEPLGAR
jgi:hypothetical protein